MRGASLAETNALVAVLEQKSFTKAAKLLGLSTPRVSDMVRSLEERLGVRLVERTTRSVAPTTAGERPLERLRPVLDEYQAALDSTNEFRGKPAGMLRLTAVPPAADLVLEEAVPRFLALYPEINVEISIDASPIDIVAERFDAGIRAGEYLAQDMIAVRICREMHFVVVAAPAYLARRGEPKSPQIWPRMIASAFACRAALSFRAAFELSAALWRFMPRYGWPSIVANSRSGPRSKARACFRRRSTM